MKKCTDCGLEKPETDFYPHKQNKGLYPYCKPCHNRRKNLSWDPKKRSAAQKRHKALRGPYQLTQLQIERAEKLAYEMKRHRITATILADQHKCSIALISLYRTAKNPMSEEKLGDILKDIEAIKKARR